MITCVVDYTIDPGKIEDFEKFAAQWIAWSTSTAVGTTATSCRRKGPATKRWRCSVFPSFAAYEKYRDAFRCRPRVHRGGPHPRRQRMRVAIRAVVHASLPRGC